MRSRPQHRALPALTACFLLTTTAFCDQTPKTAAPPKPAEKTAATPEAPKPEMTPSDAPPLGSDKVLAKSPLEPTEPADSPAVDPGPAGPKPPLPPLPAELAPSASPRLSGVSAADVVKTKVESFFHGKTGRRIHIQTDKPLYKPGETIWFKTWDLQTRSLSRPPTGADAAQASRERDKKDYGGDNIEATQIKNLANNKDDKRDNGTAQGDTHLKAPLLSSRLKVVHKVWRRFGFFKVFCKHL